MAAAHDQQASTRATGVVGIAILCSRVLGLIREQVFAGLFGAGKNLDAFLMAFRLPNLLRDLFAEGALSTAFITTFSKKIATEGDESAWRLANKVVTLTAVFMSAVTTARDYLRAAVGRFADVVELAAGQNRADDFTHADHVAIHAPRLPCGTGHGNTQRETRFRRAGDGLELFQSWLDYRRHRHRLVARSPFRRAFAHRVGDRHTHWRHVAINGAISGAAARWLQISCRFSMARCRACAQSSR